MADDTLYTFLLPSIHDTSIVELFGSWDNFSSPYKMQYDNQMGHGHWYGCFTFKNVICDGDPSNCSRPRDGGLKMGGTYWYYYKRNGNFEFHNPTDPSTNSCPLLPGQTVNVLEIPCMPISERETSAVVGTNVLTMDPSARFNTPAPPRSKKVALSLKSDRPKSAVPSVELKIRNRWFSESTGRLQTGVVDYCIGALAGKQASVSTSFGRVAHQKRNLKSAPGKVDCEKCAETPPVKPLGNLIKRHASFRRPRSRYGVHPSTQGSAATSDAFDAELFGNPFLEDFYDELGKLPSRSLSLMSDQTHAVKTSSRPQSQPCTLRERAKLRIPNSKFQNGASFANQGSRPASAPNLRGGPPADIDFMLVSGLIMQSRMRRSRAKTTQKSALDYLPSSPHMLGQIPEDSAVDGAATAISQRERGSVGLESLPSPGKSPMDSPMSLSRSSSKRLVRSLSKAHERRKKPILEPVKTRDEVDSPSSATSPVRHMPSNPHGIDYDKSHGAWTSTATSPLDVPSSWNKLEPPPSEGAKTGLDSPPSLAWSSQESAHHQRESWDSENSHSLQRPKHRQVAGAALGLDLNGSQETIKPGSQLTSRNLLDCSPVDYEAREKQDLFDSWFQGTSMFDSEVVQDSSNTSDTSAESPLSGSTKLYSSPVQDLVLQSKAHDEDLSDFDYLSAAIL
ncbi:MAG: hypothetical protein M1831_001887 [Alyxoria varia]|nr:MAG: hypothetical protein M1831_001887 [Alyxoria varia]